MRFSPPLSFGACALPFRRGDAADPDNLAAGKVAMRLAAALLLLLDATQLTARLMRRVRAVLTHCGPLRLTRAPSRVCRYDPLVWPGSACCEERPVRQIERKALLPQA